MLAPLPSLLLCLLILAPPALLDGRAGGDPGRPRGQRADTWLAFVMNAHGRTADRGRLASQPTSELGELPDTAIAALRPGLDASARLVHGPTTFAALTGDGEHDFVFGEMPGGDLDALGLRRVGPKAPRWHSGAWVLSTEHAWGTAWPAVAEEYQGALDGSLFSLSRASDGSLQVRHLLRELQVAAALGQVPHQGHLPDVDVDAFAQDEQGNLFLSFRHDEEVNGVWLEDDGVVCLPAEQLAYNADGAVVDLVTGCARIVLDKGRVDALVQASGALSGAGHPLQSLTDLQALELDPLGGTFEPVEPVPGLEGGVPHLLFNGQSLGATVLTTRDGGRLARIDGRPLGPRGRGLGLDPLTSDGATADLNGLALGRTDRLPPLVMAPATLTQAQAPLALGLAGFRPHGWAWLLIQVVVDPPAGFLFDAVPPGTGSASAWPWLLAVAPQVALPVPIDRYGRARLELSAEGSGNARLMILAQAYEVGSGELSLPAAIYRP